MFLSYVSLLRYYKPCCLLKGWIYKYTYTLTHLKRPLKSGALIASSKISTVVSDNTFLFLLAMAMEYSTRGKKGTLIKQEPTEL